MQSQFALAIVVVGVFFTAVVRCPAGRTMLAHFGLATDPSAAANFAETVHSLRVYRLGKLMLSLAGGDASPADGAQPSVRMTEDTRTNRILVYQAMLVGKKLLAYNTPISKYWPEFAMNSKGTITVAELMRHQAGLATFNETLKDFAPDWLEGWAGWTGAGGSLFQWNAERQVSFAY
eukprot:gene16186-35108_t